MLMTMTFVPFLFGAIRCIIALLLIIAAIAKLRAPRLFAEALSGYLIAPAKAVPALAVLIPSAELLLGLGLLFSASIVSAATGSIFMFILFAVAVAINILKGREDVPCGCLGAGSTRLGWGLVIRNLIFAGALCPLLWI
jgi:hypothetical protein